MEINLFPFGRIISSHPVSLRPKADIRPMKRDAREQCIIGSGRPGVLIAYGRENVVIENIDIDHVLDAAFVEAGGNDYYSIVCR